MRHMHKEIDSNLVDEVREYVLHLFDEHISDKLSYHSNKHTLAVLENAEIIARNSGISEGELNLIRLAALFHDVGYIRSYENHESRSVAIALDFLSSRNLDKKSLDIISEAIMSTSIPQKPKDMVSSILCDADLMHLAADDYFDQAEPIRKEWANIGRASLNEAEFLKTSREFFKSHHYHTQYGLSVLAPRKEINLKRIEARLAQIRQPRPSLVRSTNTFTDIWYYLFKKPPAKTLVEHHNSQARLDIVNSILQRTGIDVGSYKMLNLHGVGVEAPASYVFDELMQWSGDAICWPNHIAKVELQNNSLERIRIYLFGISRRILGLNIFHLFDLNALKIQHVPAALDPDNARYLLYECKGGYPIGVFSMFVRSSIPERGEHEMSQLFIMVSFNFYGKTTQINIFNKVWESIHNRVTSNVVYRIKQLCENKFESFTHEEALSD